MDDEQQVIAEISRQMIGAIAPGELPMFRANSAAFFASPEQALRPAKGKEEMLGFGIAEAAHFVTPVVMMLVTTAVNFVIIEIKKSARAESESVIASWVKALFSRIKPSASAPAASAPTAAPNPSAAGAGLNREQLAELHRVALEKARQYVDEIQAKRLADELVGHLVLA